MTTLTSPSNESARVTSSLPSCSVCATSYGDAIGREHPQEGLLVYTDSGSQYTSQHFQALLMRYGFQQSMSRKSNPYDNAIMESFYRTLKRELVQDAHYDNPDQARQDIFSYIESTTTLSGSIQHSVGSVPPNLKLIILKYPYRCILPRKFIDFQ